MPTTVYAEKHVYMYVRMDRWMDARLHVRNVLCIMIDCVSRYVCICGDLHSNYVHMNLSMSVYMCNICMYVCL